MSESKSNFVRQSAWLAATTLLTGGFMIGAQLVGATMGREQFEIFGTMLRLFLVLGIPSSGLQVVFAHQAAAAVTPEAQRQLAGTLRGVLPAIFALWLVMLLATLFWHDELVRQLKLGDGRVLWPTLGVVLTWLTLPVFRGLLQGRQDFGALGWVGLLDGFGRVVVTAAIVLLLHGHAAGAMGGALVGQLFSLGVAVWSTREVWRWSGPTNVAWREWFRRMLPYTLGAGGLIVLANFDLVFLKAAIPEAQAERFGLGQLYQPAAMIGFALTQITVPLAMVMFPKIARSAATGAKSDALAITLAGTALLGALSWLGVLLLPKLPLQILFFRTPASWAAAPMVPWCVFAMLAFALANVLVTHQLARARFAVVPAVLVVALVFVGTLGWLAPRLPTMEPLAAYRAVAGVVGGFNLLLLALAAWLTWGRSAKTPAPTAP
jgi:O-antigen/teichoic acid export membrane protein